MGKRHAKQPVMRAVTRALRIRIGVVCAGFALVCFTVLPARLVQLQIMDMLFVPDEETLYDFLETYSS